jgi:hypothetical protein
MDDQFLEISAYPADEGELIGKHPGDVPSQILSLKFRAQNPLKTIREKCLDIQVAFSMPNLPGPRAVMVI